MFENGPEDEPVAHWASSGYDKGRRTRRRIVTKAGGLFAAQGYSGTSMEQIARATGMTKGAVYAHFKRKRELYLACMEDSLSFFREPVELDAGAGPEQRLDAYLRWFGGRLAGEPTARSFFVQIIREEQDDQPKIDLILGLLSQPYAQLRSLIEAVNAEADAGAFAFFVFSTLLLDPELHRYHVLMAGDPTRSHSLDATVDQLMAAIRGAGRSDASQA
ncbi:MAG TPA: TetR/AcrR family transcriptional regulator [Pseudonocardia sp.]|jgi:AcrR family transcriptional regulator|nr:TetR/AcrR family transcriptional regulator [Pseudonocardia sp.]